MVRLKFIVALALFAGCVKVIHAQGGLADLKTVVTLSSGLQVRGRRITTASGNVGFAWQGLPYAQPPVGELRFRPTVPLSSNAWPVNVVLNCTAYGAACSSNSSFTTSPQSPISEDCLTLNIFSGRQCVWPILNGGQRCPVLYYIHGGGYEFDSPRMFPPDTLIDNFASKGLVIVTVGYRLGAFGFWQTPKQNVSDNVTSADGNYGLYDILEGLKFVQQEISVFGGDASSMTIMGHSSGATCTSLLSMLPAAQGLFTRVVAMSGSNPTSPPFSVFNDAAYNAPLDTSAQLAVHLGCYNESTQHWNNVAGTNWTSVIDCMRQADADEIIGWQRAMEQTAGPGRYFVFQGPSVDGDLVPDYPSQLAKHRPPLPFLLGTTKNEYGFGTSHENITVRDVCSPIVQAGGFAHADILLNECVDYYEGQFVNDSDSAIDQLSSDQQGYLPCWQEANSVRGAGGTVFLYSFDYERVPGQGLVHAADLTFVMGVHPDTFIENDTQIAQIYPTYFANFAKSGNPTPSNAAAGGSAVAESWKPLDAPDGFNYYSINAPPLGGPSTNKPMYHYDAINFWQTIAPAVDAGATYEDQQLGVSVETPAPIQPGDLVTASSIDSTTQAASSGVNYKTAFWVTLGIAIVLLLALVVGLLLRYFKHKKDGTSGDEETGDNERTPLIPPKEKGKETKKDSPKEETAMFGDTSTVPTDAEDEKPPAPKEEQPPKTEQKPPTPEPETESQLQDEPKQKPPDEPKSSPQPEPEADPVVENDATPQSVGEDEKTDEKSEDAKKEEE